MYRQGSDVLVKCVSVSMSAILYTCRGGVSNVAYGGSRITTRCSCRGHLRDLRPPVRRYLLAGHQADDPGRDVGGQVRIAIDHAVAIDLQVRQQATTRPGRNGRPAPSRAQLGLAALGHRRDQDVVAVHDVVDDRHRGPWCLRAKPKMQVRWSRTNWRRSSWFMARSSPAGRHGGPAGGAAPQLTNIAIAMN